MGASPSVNVDAVRTLAELRRRVINYRRDEAREPEWKFDSHRTELQPERPGPPEPGAVWERARCLIENYEFSDAEIVRAVYDSREPLLGRTMLLEGRFVLMRFYLGVRITSVTDRTGPDGQRVWGWAYETLEGHLERGRISYEVVKHQPSGRVEFVITAFSQRAPTLGPLLRLGWALFGRRTQRQFYRHCGARLRTLTALAAAPDAHRDTPHVTAGLVLAPSDAKGHPSDRISLRIVTPS